MAARYTPRAGDLARDEDDKLWFIYASAHRPSQLYAIGTRVELGEAETPIKAVGSLRLECRPAT